MRKPFRFTLIELMVVVCIIVILMSLLLPALASVRTKAKIATCSGNLKQQMVAYVLYANDNNGRLPYNCNPSTPHPADSYNYRNFLNLIYPDYIGSGAIFYCPDSQWATYANVSFSASFKPATPGSSQIKYYYFGWDQNGSSIYGGPWTLERRGTGKNIISCDCYYIPSDVSNHGSPMSINTLYLDGHVKMRMPPLAGSKEFF